MNAPDNVEENGSWKISIFSTVKKKFWLCVRVALFCVLIVGVWSAFSLPILIYHLPISEISSDTSDANASGSDSMCSSPLQYATTNGICLTEFANILTSSNCPLDAEGNVLVVRNEEDTATKVINGLNSLGASAGCISKASPFFCVHLFGLCGGLEVTIQPTTSQCEEIRDTLCQHQWKDVQRLGIDLPDCSMFPAEASSCPALNGSRSTNVTEKHTNGSTVTDLECREGFYKENGSSICTPSCYTWMQSSQGVTIFRDVANFISAFIGLIATTAVIMISCLGRKRMFVFPAVFVVYMSIDVLVLSIFVTVSYLKRDRLFCSSKSLTESKMEVTPFCVISGIVFTYAYSQISLWWLFHIASLFWHVVFPFRAQTFEATGKNKYIHMTCIIVGILLPLVPIITVMADFAVDIQKQNQNATTQHRNSLFLKGGLGFQPTTFPTTLCFGRPSDAIIYSFGSMIGFITALGCSLLIIIFWSIQEAHIKRKKMQQDLSSGKQFTFGKAEKKLLSVLCYYVLLAILYPIPYFLYVRNYAQFLESLQNYFICEQDPSNSCRFSFENNGQAVFGILSSILLGMFPIMNLLYVVNIQELKKLWTWVHGS